MRLPAFLFAVFLAPVANASPVSLCGPSICYEYDDGAAQNPGITLLGQPTLLGNSDVLRFTPTAFVTESVGSEASVTATFQFTRIWSPLALEIAAISVAAYGDYQILGSGSAGTRLSLTAVDQTDDSGSSGYPESTSIAGLVSPPGPTGLPFANWELTSSLTPAEVFDDLAASLSLTIDLQLDGRATGPGDAVFLAEKLLLVSAVTVVPGPPALPLILTGLMGLLGVGYRRRRD